MANRRSAAPPTERATPSKPQVSAIDLSDYPADQYVIPASDDKGHSARGNFRYATSLEMQAEAILSSHIWPFEDKSALFRWCVFEGMKALGSLRRVPNSVMAQAEAAIRISRTILFQQQFDKTFAVMDETFAFLRQRGALGELKRYYAEVKHEFSQMPDGYWRGYYLSQMQSRYGHLVGDAPAPVAVTAGPIAVVGGTEANTPNLPPAQPTPAPPRRMLSAIPQDGDDAGELDEDIADAR